MSIPFKRKLLCSLVVALIPVLATAEEPQRLGSGTGQNIPGIDQLPRATSNTQTNNESATEQPVTSDQETQQPANEGGALAFPLITNIKVEPHPELPYSARISWEGNPANTTAIWVGRFVRPINSVELVFQADSIASPPLGPRETSFVDRNIPDGAYYYVIVTQYEIANRGRMLLRGGANFTEEPFIVYRGDQGTVNETDASGIPHVRSLFAVNSGGTVKLSWAPPAASGDYQFHVYRSVEPLATPTALRVATRLGVVAGTTFNFADEEPLRGRTVYYAVMTVDRTSGREQVLLRPDVTVISHQFEESQLSDDQLRYLPDALTVYLESGDSVKLLWVDPEVDLSDLRVYRHNRPINSVQVLERARFVGVARPGENSFRDPGLRPGMYYYAVLPRDTNRREVRLFQEGRSFTGFGVQIREAPEQDTTDNTTTDNTNTTNEGNQDLTQDEIARLERPTLSGLEASASTSAVELKWTVLATERARDFRMLLYRSRLPLASLDAVRSNGTFLDELASDRRSYIDSGLEPGRYFYALIIDVAGDLDRPLVEGRNYLSGPVTIAEQNPEEDGGREQIGEEGDLTAINRILAATYHRRRYGEAIRRLAPYIVESNRVAPNVRAKALLYTGISYYYLRQYRSALEFFVHDLVRTEYPERARFWYSRAVERVR